MSNFAEEMDDVTRYSAILDCLSENETGAWRLAAEHQVGSEDNVWYRAYAIGLRRAKHIVESVRDEMKGLGGAE